MRLSLLTFNAGLLRVGPLLEPAGHVEKRFGMLAAALRECAADVIVLQEVYGTVHVRALCAALAAEYPHHGPEPHGVPLRLGHGLLTLSRFPMTATLHRFRAGTLEERWLAVRGTLVARISVGGNTLSVGNVHATAGGLLRHPEAPAVDILRAAQIADARAAVEGNGLAILAGDFNCGPGASFANYRATLDAGWIDCSAGAPDFGEPTWDPGNPLNRRGPHRTSPAQRIDHVLARRADVEAGRVRPLASRIVLREPRVAIGSGHVVPLSDHYGVQAELELGSR